MSLKGCSPDNAACEGFFGRPKTELFYPRQWQATSIEQFIQVLDSYIRWYNESRTCVRELLRHLSCDLLTRIPAGQSFEDRAPD